MRNGSSVCAGAATRWRLQDPRAAFGGPHARSEHRYRHVIRPGRRADDRIQSKDQSKSIWVGSHTGCEVTLRGKHRRTYRGRASMWTRRRPQGTGVRGGGNGGSSMIRLIDRTQRPHCAPQARRRKSSPVVRGGGPVAIAVRTSWSLRTLQEQMIIEAAQSDEFGLGSGSSVKSLCRSGQRFAVCHVRYGVPQYPQAEPRGSVIPRF
jgi:hypothetical protein